MHSGVNYHVLRTTAELQEFESDWWQLWQQDLRATPFQSPAWLLPWWHQFGSSEARAVLVLQDGLPAAFLPFYKYERQVLLIGAGTTDYLDGVYSPACRREHVEAGLAVLEEFSDWDVLNADQLPSHSPLRRLFLGDSYEGQPCSRMPALALPELPAKIRRNAMYYRNLALRRGTLSYSVATENKLAEVFDALVSLHTARWQSVGERGVLADKKVLAWHGEALPLLHKEGLLRLSTLTLDKEVIGVLYSLIDGRFRQERTQYFYLPAFSIDHADLRPGTLLIAYAAEYAKAEGVHTIDMLRGDEAYKKIWHVEPVPTYGFSLRHPMVEQESWQRSEVNA